MPTPSMNLDHPPFRVEIWCEHCCGVDFDGCFDGGSAKLGESFAHPAGETFTTVDEAIAVGQTWQPSGEHPWTFRVIDALGLDVRIRFRGRKWLYGWEDADSISE